jgi:flagellar basal body-associated protein FliL
VNEPEKKEEPEQKGPGCGKIIFTSLLIVFGVLIVVFGGCILFLSYPRMFH